MKREILLLLFLSGFVAAEAQKTDLASQANAFLSMLTPEIKAKAQFAYTDEERSNWNFVPLPRKGATFHDLNETQQAALLELIRNSLSEQGFQKAKTIMAHELILRGVEGRGENDNYRDPQKYYISIFGTPAKDKVWGWRLEGHHLSLNFSSVNGMVDASTPSFMGSNPAIVPSGPNKGLQILKEETELGYQFMRSLSEEQQQKAIFSDKALPEIVTSNARKASALEPKGILFGSLSKEQKTAFEELLNLYVKNYQFGFANKLMEKIRKAGMDNLSFAWAGSLQQGEGHYYRIQGPMLLIEYDNTQSNANHVHTAVRDLTNDFAEDILREHYAREHK